MARPTGAMGRCSDDKSPLSARVAQKQLTAAPAEPSAASTPKRRLTSRQLATGSLVPQKSQAPDYDSGGLFYFKPAAPGPALRAHLMNESGEPDRIYVTIEEL